MRRRNDQNFTKPEEVGDWYDEKYTEMKGGWYTPVEEINAHLDALGCPADASGVTLLDIGSGDGQLLVEAYRRGARCFGVDVSAVGRAMTAQRFEREFGLEMGWIHHVPANRIHIAGDSMERMRWAFEFFDFCISLGSMEHALDIQKAVAEMARVLKRRGRWLIYVPTLDWVHTDQVLETVADPSEWASLCQSHGLSVMRIEVMNDNARITGGKP